MIEISEEEFLRAENTSLMSYAQKIKKSGISLYEIAKGCNLSWKTVNKAAEGCIVSLPSLIRIMFYIKKKIGDNGQFMG